jgi:hypothetical protein
MEEEINIVSHMTEMQSIDFGLSAVELRRCVFHTAMKTEAITSFNNVPEFGIRVFNCDDESGYKESPLF